MKKCLDPRSKILVVLFLNIILFSANNQFVFIFNILLVLSLFFFSRQIKAGIICAVFISALLVIQYSATIINNQSLQITIAMLSFFTIKCSIVGITAYWFTKTTKIGDLISSMQAIHLPKGLIVTFSVIFRFLPTVLQEFWYIKSTLKLRGVAINLKNIFTHPLRTIEFALVPLITRSMIIGNRLSSSAMARGLDLERCRSSYNIVSLGLGDFAFCSAVIALSVSSIFVGGML